MERLKNTYRETLYISKITGVTKKKLRILFSVLLSNVVVLIDVVIILIFSQFLTDSNIDNLVINFIMEKQFLIPIIVIVRFGVNVLEKINIISLKLQVEKNLRVYLLNEIYKKGNYSIADATFYIGTLSGHVGFFYGALTSFINSFIQIIIYSSFLIYSDLQTILIFGVGAIILFIPTRLLLKLGRKYMHESYINSQQTSRDIQRVVDNLFLIKILGTKKEEIQRYEETTQLLESSQLKNQLYGTINSLMPNMFTLFILSILFIVTNLKNVITLEFLGVTLRLVQTIGALNSSLNMMINSQVHLSKFIELENNKLIERTDYYKIEEMADIAIELKNISFKYFNAENKIIDNLNLNFYKDKHTIITGPNGSGKSTLLGIISKVLYPEEGNLQLYTNNIGYVGVTPLIINGSLRENLLYGNKTSISDELLKEYIMNFQLFNDFEKNLDTNVNSKTLSSGQMQKISFIRALLANAQILLLDESTSNLDTETKTLIFDILKKHKVTIINSTHNKDDFDYDHHIKISYLNDIRSFDYIV